jgi:hypothetical protein
MHSPVAAHSTSTSFRTYTFFGDNLKRILFGLVSLILYLSLAQKALTQEPAGGGGNEPDGQRQITINFDNLFSGTIITNQYPGAIFSAMGFSGGVGTGQWDYNIRASNSKYRSYPNGIMSWRNVYWPGYGYISDNYGPV